MFHTCCLISWGQEVTLNNLTQYIEFWPSEIKTTQEVILSNGITIPPNTRSEILDASKDGITISNQIIRDKGYFKYVTSPEKTDLFEKIRQNRVSNSKNLRISESLSPRLLVNKNGRPETFRVPENKEYFLLYFSANWCAPCHKTIENVKKFLTEHQFKNVQPILISAADKTESEFQSYIQKHNVEWPYFRFNYSGPASPIFFNYYLTNNSKGTIPQFILIDRAGRLLVNYRVDEKPFSKIADIITRNSVKIEKDLAGTIHPNVKYVDTDQFTYFQHGYCSIKKGDKYAVINAKGEMVTPWQTKPQYNNIEQRKYFAKPVYDSKGSYVPYSVNAISWGNAYPTLSVFPDFAVFDNLQIYSDNLNKVGYMKPDGEKLTTPQYTSATPFINNLALVTTLKGVHLINRKFEIINPDVLKNFPGRQAVNFRDALDFYNLESLTILLVSELFPAQDINFKWGYYSKTGKLVIPHQFDEASIFSEGLACIGKKDKFGEMYYGFIDAKGKYAIEPKFRIKPGDFHCGRAVVMPYKGDGSFAYGYIDKMGELVIKVNSIEKSTRYSIDFDRWLASFHDGIAYSLLESKVIIDTTGRIYDLRKYPIFFGGGFNHSTEIKGQQIVMNRRLLFSSGGVAQKYGIMDIEGNILIPPIFTCLSNFDSYSGLAFASYQNGNKFFSGFINQQGQFVILKKDDQSTW
jgi:thiol-disulfide isomerase/thioredoxin